MSSKEVILDVLYGAGVDDTPPLDMLLSDVKNLQRERWDWARPDRFLRRAYASLYLNLDEALAWRRAVSADQKAKYAEGEDGHEVHPRG